MFHYADVSLSIIDDLINFEEELQVLKRSRKFKLKIDKNYLGYRKISDSGMPIDEMSDCLQGHTSLEIFTEDEKAKSAKLFNEILEFFPPKCAKINKIEEIIITYNITDCQN